MAEDEEKVDDALPLACLRRVRSFIWRWFKKSMLLPLAWIALVLIGLLPVNNDFRQDPNGIEVLFLSNAIHSDIVLPLVAADLDWRARIPESAFKGNVSESTHVAIGWGDRGFFIETPQWSDLKISTAANALLWPSSTCIHVSMIERDWLGDEGITIKLSAEQYRRLVDAICESFVTGDDHKFVPIAGESYGWRDAFFESTGSYYILNTCNNWVGRAMKRSGIRVGWFTPLPKTIYLWLPDE